MLWVHNNSAEDIAEALQPQFPDTDKEVLVALINRYKDQDTWRPDLILGEDGLERMFTIMEQAGELDERPPYDKIVNTKFAEGAMKKVKLK